MDPTTTVEQLGASSLDNHFGSSEPDTAALNVDADADADADGH